MKIFWTFDPFDQNKKLQKFGKSIINTYFTKEDEIIVSYVASNAEVNLATAYNIPRDQRYSDYPEKLIKKELIKLGLKKLKILVLPTISLSLSASVKLLAAHAKKEHVDLILIATNARPTLPRLVFGSFAETLVHLSLSDILIYHQKTKFDLLYPESILFAHDFSSKGDAGLLRVIKYAQKWGSRLIIVHALKPEYNSESESIKSIMKNKQKIEKLVESEGLVCKVILEPKIGAIAKTIMNTAKKEKAKMIVLTAKSGNLVAAFGGRIVREVLRESTLLTLVIKA